MLSEQDRAMLDFEEQRFLQAGHKQAAIRESFGMSATRYYQRLNTLIDDVEAVAYAPTLVNRLRRLRHDRQRPAKGSTAS
jgi:Protein of unknown function (DUF3263)